MDRKEIIARIEHLQFRLFKLYGEDEALVKMIADFKCHRERIKKRRKEISTEITKLKVEVLKMGL